MDTLTHALSGALLARATEPTPGTPGALPRRLRMWVGFWTAAFPDSDFVLRFIDPLTYITLHRGVTHSVLLLPLWAALLALIFFYITRKRYSWKAFFGVCALGVGVHIVGDIITSFGTILLAPFSSWRAQLSTTFIIDPYFSAIIVAGLLAALYWKNTRLPAIAGLAGLTLLVGFQYLQSRRAIEVGRTYATTQQLPAARVHVLPQPFSPFHWLVVVEQPDQYRFAHISLTRQQAVSVAPDASWLRRVNASYQPVSQAAWQTVSRFGDGDTALAQAAWQTPGLARYRDFAMLPLLIRIDRSNARTCAWFTDLRFNMSGRSGPFQYGACRDANGAPWRTYQLTNGDDGEEIFELIPD